MENTTDEYEIISGHRRFRAAQKAGLKEVPAFIRPVTRAKSKVIIVGQGQAVYMAVSKTETDLRNTQLGRRI